MASTTPAPIATTLAAPAGPAQTILADTMLPDASLYAAIAVALFALSLFAPKERRRGLMLSAILSAVMLAGLAALARFGDPLANATLYEIIREALLALLAVAVIRAVLIFVTRVLLGRFSLPHILIDVLLALSLVVYALYRLNAVGVNLAGIVTTSAVLTGAIAFSAQEILGALWAGLALQGERTVRVGDWLRYNDKLGQVVQLRWRSTSIATCDHETIIIPNASLMKDKITLVGRHGDDASWLRRHIPFVVSYDHAPSAVVKAINDSLQRAEIHNMRRDPTPFCVCKSFEDNGVGYEVLYHIQDPHHYLETDSAVFAHVFAALQRHGMTIPFPHRVVRQITETDEQRQQREHARRHAILDRIELFAPLNDEERDMLAKSLQRCPFVVDDVISRQGESADSLYVLAEGTASVFHEDGTGQRRKLAALEAPAYFGEMGLLLGQPRRATVTAAGDVLCYRLAKADFDKVLRARPDIIEGLSRVLAQRQAANDATLSALDAEARARRASGHAAEFVRMIRGFFGVGSSAPAAAVTTEEDVR